MKTPLLTSCVFLLPFTVALCLPTVTKAGSPTVISSVPYIITSPGQYSLEDDLELSHADFAAIVVETSHVLIDLNGHMLSGKPAFDAEVIGIAIQDGKGDVVVRNGTISAFWTAIYSALPQTRVEKMAVVGNFHGVRFDAGDCAVTGSFIIGAGSAGSNPPVGIQVHGPNTLIESNQISEFYYAIRAFFPCGIVHNFVADSVVGLSLGSGAYYQGNVAVNCGTAFTGGTPIGQENGGH